VVSTRGGGGAFWGGGHVDGAAALTARLAVSAAGNQSNCFCLGPFFSNKIIELRPCGNISPLQSQ